MSSPSEPPIQIPYALAPQRLGITYEKTADELRIIIPPPPWVRQTWLIIFLALMVCSPIGVISYSAVYLPDIKFKDAAGFVFQYLFILGFAVSAHAHLVSRTEIALTREHLRLTRFHQFGKWGRNLMSQTIPRSKIYDIHHVSHSGNIVVHAHGLDLLEFRVSNSAEVSIWVADAIQDAAGLAVAKT